MMKGQGFNVLETSGIGEFYFLSGETCYSEDQIALFKLLEF